ncbi:EAL domain-containing protein [Desulfovibrio sp. OttesenSCG-928-F20]|nr:EAL domain-containing protein [Desulfovibrio sp. OttesenSCG-928-M16]MDL2290651.1 EAL domain-containing protein [Desulfovibrio sp. OttesenSCG-928-F20]
MSLQNFRPQAASHSGGETPLKRGDRFYALLSLHEAPLLRAFRHGVMLVMPLLLAAAIAILLNNFPLMAYQHFMSDVFGPDWKLPGATIYNASIEILALATTFTLSDCLMGLHNQKYPDKAVLPVLGTLTAFSCLFIMIGPRFGPEGMILSWAGIRGLFGALIITFASCSLFLWLCRFKRLRLSYYSEGADPVLPHMFDTLLPILITLATFLTIQETLLAFGIESLHKAFYDSIRSLFSEAHDSFGLGALYAFLVQLCWFFGIHGADLLDPITHHVLVKGMEINSLAINNHVPPPYIFTKYFFDVYIYMGGSGATLSLLAAIFLRSRDQGARRVAAISLVPGIFNINELLVFGLPVVLNPAFLIPFLLVPLVLLIVSYLAIVIGFAPIPVYQVDWITPPIINAYISTDSWRGVALQLFNMGVATIIYYPFVALADKVKVAGRRKAFDELVAIVQSQKRGPNGMRCIDWPGAPGALARSLTNDMSMALKNQDESMRLHYQPRVDVVAKNVPCVEALLRWEHPFYGPIPAILTLAIAEDADLTRELDNYVIQMAFEQQFEWRKNGVFTSLAVNISEQQLQDKEFPHLLNSLYARHNLSANAILLELNETLVLDPAARYMEAIENLHETGAGIAVDDFGKVYQAIAQLKRLPLSELQIDRSMVKDIDNNKLNQDVLGTIQETAYKLGIRTSAEYVENQDQLELLLELNFSNFQGYWFSEAVPARDCADFIRSFSKTAVFEKSDE